jgi:glycosyltransferase involved in cell wall biosynthesis
MNSTTQPLVSIVTPVYNEEEHLAECIESVLAQTYSHWDYTIVNNCSTDRTLEIARRYAAKDSRIRIHENKEFLALRANINLAVRQISPESKYCKVVFGDDWIFPGCLEKMVAVAEAHPSVGIVSSYQLHGQQVRSKGLPRQQKVVNGREACRQCLLQTCILFGTENSVLYRADLVRSRNPFYVETEACSDFEACFALLRTSDLGFVHEVLTFSRPRAKSSGTIAFDVGAQYKSFLGILFKYGKECLTDEEFQESLELYLSQYYTFLGRRFWVERDQDFWSYHKRTLAKFGIAFSRARLAKAAVGQLCGSVLKPKSIVEAISRLSKLRKMRDSQTRKVVPGFGSDRVEADAQPNGRP